MQSSAQLLSLVTDSVGTLSSRLCFQHLFTEATMSVDFPVFAQRSGNFSRWQSHRLMLRDSCFLSPFIDYCQTHLSSSVTNIPHVKSALLFTVEKNPRTVVFYRRKVRDNNSHFKNKAVWNFRLTVLALWVLKKRDCHEPWLHSEFHIRPYGIYCSTAMRGLSHHTAGIRQIHNNLWLCHHM